MLEEDERRVDDDASERGFFSDAFIVTSCFFSFNPDTTHLHPSLRHNSNTPHSPGSQREQ